ncbi:MULTISPECIES: hypothetical protein [unclassified Pseudomonas]|uniref:scabin-related ADP-ribosyltransferase n=1 Tax=unclassified Pseudomonas TaxID=196821 RepID=UPI0011A1348F|nr:MULTISPECIES: hypothetical protein [unclassified Pseudomonas]TWC10511.1 hypothetical protein FBY00_1478 [Pseudomonas sp. SJZ075]TWC26674.1 hypothetical protein FBY02_14816 [Pseudomonas sp. SJZ078]TWC45756.1 hypothetical protein FBY11_14816 [Pseudomonas sp. SJZ124]TWC81108.1 hypothetical protein FBY09_1468 [Pseudomonas sp. SJZ101]
MNKGNGFIRATTVAVVIIGAAWQPGNNAWGATQLSQHRKEEPWYEAWLQVTADPSVDIRKTQPLLRWRTDLDTLYRGDTTNQGLEAFRDGLLPKSVAFPEATWMYDWFKHGAGAQRSVYSSTTRSQRIAQSFANEWVFEFKAPHGIDQQESGGPIIGEEEISYPGGVKGQFIKQACKKTDLTDCVANLGYHEPSGHETMLEVAATPIDWSKITPPEGLAWVTNKESLWAVGSLRINPVQGADALTSGLRARNSQPPVLRWASSPESPSVQSVIVAFRDYSDAKIWAVTEAANGGWVYEVRPNSVAVDLSGEHSGNRPGAFAFIGGIKGGLLMNARRFEKGVTEPVECIGIEKEACRLENRHQ